MTTTDEQKPPVGEALIDYNQLGGVHTVMGALLAARAELLSAENRARRRNYPAVGLAIESFVAHELDRLFCLVLPMLDRPETLEACYARMQADLSRNDQP